MMKIHKKELVKQSLLRPYYTRKRPSGEVEVRCGDSQAALCDTTEEAEAWIESAMRRLRVN